MAVEGEGGGIAKQGQNNHFAHLLHTVMCKTGQNGMRVAKV
jgi:hypothetical protein